VREQVLFLTATGQVVSLFTIVHWLTEKLGLSHTEVDLNGKRDFTGSVVILMKFLVYVLIMKLNII